MAKIGVLSVAWPVKPHEFPNWISQRMRACKVQATQSAIDQLALRTEGNLLAAAQEIDKLALLETYGVAGSKAAACAILQDAAPLPGGKTSACEDKLAAFVCP